MSLFFPLFSKTGLFFRSVDELAM